MAPRLSPALAQLYDQAKQKGNANRATLAVARKLVAYLMAIEDEVKKIDERADKLEATIPDLENEQKKHALRELVKHLRDEASEHRKYLALVKQK